jgi:hypothetical protein
VDALQTQAAEQLRALASVRVDARLLGFEQ